MIARIQEELGEEAATIATGGLAGVVVPYTEAIDEVDELLTLKGLKLLTLILFLGSSLMLAGCALKIPPFGADILTDAGRAQIPGQ